MYFVRINNKFNYSILIFFFFKPIVINFFIHLKKKLKLILSKQIKIKILFLK